MRLHLHWHMYVGTVGANRYFECRCGDRIAREDVGVIGPTHWRCLNHETDDLHENTSPRYAYYLDIWPR